MAYLNPSARSFLASTTIFTSQTPLNFPPFLVPATESILYISNEQQTFRFFTALLVITKV